MMVNYKIKKYRGRPTTPITVLSNPRAACDLSKMARHILVKILLIFKKKKKKPLVIQCF